MWKCGWMGELNVDAEVNGGGGVVREDTGISGTWECGTPNRASRVGGGDEGGGRFAVPRSALLLCAT